MKTILIGILSLLPLLVSAESKLENIKKETKKEKTVVIKKSHHHKNNHDHHSDHDYDDDFFYFELIYYILLSVYALPHEYIDAGFETEASFPAYPYHAKLGAQGYLDLGEPEAMRYFSLHTSIETKLYQDDVVGYGTHINFYNTFRLDILTDYTYLTENLEEDGTADLAIGSANLTFRFAQNAYVQMRSGIGINFLFDDDTSSSGFNFIYAIDIYPGKPVFFSLRFDGGKIGSADYARLRGLVGFLYKRVELNTGFELISIGNQSLTGVILGLKVSF